MLGKGALPIPYLSQRGIKMGYSTSGKSSKQLHEDRQSMRQMVKSYLASEHDKTSQNDQKYSEMMADIEAIDTTLAKRNSPLPDDGLRQSSNEFPLSRRHIDHPDHESNRGGSNGVGGTKVDDSLTVFSRGQSVAATFGQSKYGLADVIRDRVLGRPSQDLAALGEANPTQGGYAVSVQTAASVLDLARSKSVLLRAGCQLGVMTTNELRMPRLTSDAAFQTKVENEAFNEDTQMAFGAIVFRPILIGTLVTMSRELAEDAAGFQEQIEQALANALAVQLDQFPLLGTTTDRFHVGMLSDTAIGETAATGSLTFAKVAAEATTIRGLNHEPNAVLLNPGKRDPLLDSVTSGSGEYLGVPPSLANVAMLDSTSITATKGLVGDFTKMILMVRGGPLIESSTVAGDAFKKHQIAIKLYWRGDYGLLYPNAFRRLAGIS